MKMLRPYWLGDYYPLTPINLAASKTSWCGWQFHRPDLNAGFAMFFRRPKSAQAGYEANLRGIDPKSFVMKSLSQKDMTSIPSRVMTGKELAPPAC